MKPMLHATIVVVEELVGSSVEELKGCWKDTAGFESFQIPQLILHKGERTATIPRNKHVVK